MKQSFVNLTEALHGLSAGVLREMHAKLPVHGQGLGLFFGGSVLRVHAVHVFLREIAVGAD